MRGQVASSADTAPRWRITPADAGTRSDGLLHCVYEADHPRGCGDKHQSDSMAVVVWGSPPRMRGQAQLSVSGRRSRRITPADAGTSSSVMCFLFLFADHPRGCGDKFVFVCIFRYRSGSPPRMRGQAYLRLCALRLQWITPADAGTSISVDLPV